ncbi:MAG: FG-GAP-like repeat-containing protein [Candidatus Acidiferrum sp.]
MHADPSQVRTPARELFRIGLQFILLLTVIASTASGQTYIFGRADFPTGVGPTAVVVADFNGDGIQDFAVANRGDNTISILLGKPDGTLGAKTDFATGLSPVSLVAGDFNGDKKLDIAVANSGELTFSVLLGNGAGTFQAAVPYPTRNPPNNLVSVDLNGDGKLDIATVNTTFVTSSANNSVSILLGNGDGTFAPLIDYPMDGATVSIASGDFNRDGAVDLAVANPGLETISILLGKGDGTFATPVNYGSGTGQFVNTDVVARDLNGDGNLDLGVCGSGTVSILLGKGDGTFQPHVDYTGVGQDPGSLTADDFNADGKLDLAVSNGFGGTVPDTTVSILLGKGDGTFQPPVNYNTGGQPFSVTSADINGDGKPDLVMATAFNAVTVLIGKGDGTFSTATGNSAGATPMSITTGDFNGDGKLDLASANRADNSVSVFLANGDGTFKPVATYGGGSVPRAVASGDLNGDAKDDLVVADPSCELIFPPCPTTGSISVLIANADGTFQQPVPYPVNGYPMSVVTGDFNGDGKIDVAVANGNSPGTVSVFLGKGDGTLQPPVDYATAPTPAGLAVGDLNGDGKLDLAVGAGSFSGVVSVLLGKGDGTFLAHTDYGAGQQPLSVAAADFNKDGKLDLAVANYSDNSISVLLGNGNGTFQNQTTYSPGHLETSNLAAGDFNGDGNNDIAVANGFDNAVTIFFGKGDGTFPKSLDYEYDPRPLSDSASYGITAADFRGDGGRSLAVADFQGGFGNSIYVLLNEPIAALSPGNLSFASLAVGDSSAPQSVQFSNPGPAPIVVQNTAAMGDFSETNGCASTLVGGANCSIEVTFTPTGPLNRDGAIIVTDNTFNNPQAVFLSGTGIGPGVGFSPATVAFGGQFVASTSAAKTVTLTNTGNAALTVSGFAVSGNFAQTNNCASSLAPNASCAIKVTFSPTAVGPATGAITVSDNVFGGQSVFALAGTGTDFTIAPASGSSASASVSAGGTATYKLVISPEDGLMGAVTLACTGAPSGAACSISPASVTLNGSVPSTATVSVTTTASSLIVLPQHHSPPMTRLKNVPVQICFLVLILGWVGVHVITRAIEKRQPTYRFAIMATLLIALTLTACGGGGGTSDNHPGTPAGSYSLVVTATFNTGSATVHHDVNLTLTVN